jgi:hypothetical protein
MECLEALVIASDLLIEKLIVGSDCLRVCLVARVYRELLSTLIQADPS